LAPRPPVRGAAHRHQRRLDVVIVPHRLARFVLQAAPRILELAFALIRLAFALHLLVAEQLAGAFLELAAGLLEAAFGAVFVDPSAGVVVADVTVVHGASPYCGASTHQPRANILAPRL